jgi:hypothetical protein
MSSALRHRVATARFDVVAAAVGLLLALALFPLRFFASQIYIRTIPIVLGSSCVLYLLATYRTSPRITELPTLSKDFRRTLPSLVFLCLAGLVALAVHDGQRSPRFLAVAGLTGTLILLQIAFVRSEGFNRTRVLVQVVALAAVVRFAALYTTPGLIGIDIWTHITGLAGDIMAAESLEGISSNKHYTSPLYHLLVVATALLGDVSLRLGLYLSLGVVMPVSVLLVFAAANVLVDERWAAFAAMLYSVGDYVIEWGIHLIPTSMGLALFLGVCYWLIRTMRTGQDRVALSFLFVLTVAIILTHQVSSFITLVMLGGAFLAYLVMGLDVFRPSILDPDVFRINQPVNIAGLIAFDLGFSTFLWSMTPYKGDTFLLTLLSYLRETLISSAGMLNLAGPSSAGGGAAEGAEPTTIDVLVPYLDTAGFLLLLFGTFLGCLYVVNRTRARQSTFTLLISAAVMLVFVLGLPMFGIRSFIPQRWFAFLYLPLALLTVIGLRHLELSLNRRIVVAVLLVFAAVFPMVMVVSANGTVDNPAFEEQGAQLAYNQQELAAVDTIGRITGSPDSANILPDQLLYTDHPYQTVLNRNGAYPSRTVGINDSDPVDHEMVVYRQEQARDTTFFENNDGFGVSRKVNESAVCRPEMAVVYTNEEVRMCTEPPAATT